MKKNRTIRKSNTAKSDSGREKKQNSRSKTSAKARRTESPHSSAKQSVQKDGFYVVGIGASAGGLEAMQQLLKHLPPDTGMAFILVQHLDPTHESALAPLLSRGTRMRVTEAVNNERIEPNQVYVIPPNKLMGLSGRQLKLFPRQDGKDERAPVDLFMRTMAESVGPRAIGVVLSGNGSDGTEGLLTIKTAGGVTFAQAERSAKYSGMPGNAITAGCVDFVFTPDKMALELKRLSERPRALAFDGDEDEDAPPTEQKGFESVLMQLRQRQGVDFTYYKHATLRRRIHRRMVLNKLESLKEYSHFLKEHPTELRDLFNDILIHVTGFFRDPAVFQTLRKKLIPRLLKGKSGEDPVRIWIPGCSTGEEVFSIAIALTEYMNERKVHHPVQIFGTDINEIALERARAGLYAENIVTDVSADRLRRFFLKSDGGYRVNKAIREMCIFARQNLVNDPPFSNLDLISCRNVLIYLGPTLQRKVMPVFHYALRPEGLLMLGASETIGGFADLFSLIDAKAKVYVKKGVPVRPAVSFGHGVVEHVAPRERKTAATVQPAPTISDVQKQADRIILTSYSLPGVVINKQMEVLQFRGRTGPFLEHSHGEASLNLLKMAREGLSLDLRTVVSKAIKQNTRMRQENVRVRQNGDSIECSVEVIPFSPPPATERFYLVIFEPANLAELAEPGGPKLKTRKVSPAKSKESAELVHLRDELAATRESLQAIIEEQEATNEELRSANEEIMSSNEELQSTNEELETAKEELQSTNEELTTLNDELESRNGELEQVNNDLYNLLASVNIPILMLGADLKIRRFTGIAEKMFKLIPTDIGRPISDINLPLEIPSLDKLVHDVFDSLTPKDIELKDKQGHWWSVRIRPYKTTDHKIDGAVIALVDIDSMKTGISRLLEARQLTDDIVNTVREPFVLLDKNLNVVSANQSFYRTFKVKPDDTLSRRIYDLGNRQWDIPRLRKLLEEILPQDRSFTDFEVDHNFPRIGHKKMVLNARKVGQDSYEMILLAIEELKDGS